MWFLVLNCIVYICYTFKLEIDMAPLALTEENVLKTGKMNKSPLTMSGDELRRWKKSMSADIRAYLFSIGQPLVYRKEGKMVAEYPDGEIKMIWAWRRFSSLQVRQALYNQTFLLLEKHLSLIDHMMFIHVSETENPIVCAQFDNQAHQLITASTIPEWFSLQALPLLKSNNTK